MPTFKSSGEPADLACRSRDELIDEVLRLRHEVAEAKRRNVGQQQAEAAPRPKETHVRALAEEIVDGLITIDEEGRVISFNPAAEEIFGYAAKEVIGKNVSMLMHEADGIRYDRYLARYKESGKTNVIGKGPREIVGRHRTGKDLDLEIALGRIETQGGTTFIGSLRDISGRKRELLARQESEARFRDLAAAASDWFWEMDAERTYSFVSPSVTASSGIDADWYTGRSHDEILEMFYDPEDWEPFNEAFTNRRPFRDLVFARNGEDGKRKWIRTSGLPVFGPDGDFRGFRGSAADMTDLMEAQVGLRESEDRYRALSDLSSEGVLIIDDGVIVDANQVFARMFGYEVSELVGNASLELTVPEHRQDVARRMAQNHADSYESEGLRKDGSRIPVEIRAAPIVYQGRQMRVARLRDLTENKKAEAAIRESERRYKNITDNMPALIAYIDRDQRYRSVNRLFESWYQKPVSEIIGRHMKEVMLPESYAELAESIERVLAGEAVLHEDEGETPDGIRRYRRVNYLPHRDNDGQVLGFFAMVEDISDIRRATRELEIKEARLAEAQKIGNIGNWERDFTTGELHWSEQAYRIFGQSDQTVHGPDQEGFLLLVHEEDRDFVRAGLEAAIESDTPYSLDHRIVRADGEVRVVHEEAVVIRDETGRPLRMAGTTQDITERKQAEMMLRNSEQQLRLVADAMPAVIVYVDASQRFQFVNKMAESWYARPASKFIGCLLEEVVSKEELASARRRHEMALTGQQQVYETRKTYPDGQTRDVRGSYVPHFDDEGKVIGVYALVLDMTEQLEIEEQLRHGQKMEAVGQLTGGIAHDFNNLLQIVMSNAELLSNDLEQNAARQRLIIRAAERGAELTDNLLTFSRKQSLSPQALDLTDLVDGMLDMMERTLGETIEIRTSLMPDLWTAFADSSQLENALLNLIINAWHAMADGGELTIKCRNVHLTEATVLNTPDKVTGEYVMLSISDTGTGMDRETKRRAFEPFFTTKKVGEGSGLGLSQVYGFVQQSAGHINISSEPGQGTTIMLYLPRAAAQSISAEFVEGNDVATGRGESVLVIEDDENVRASAQAMLESLGFQVVTAADAKSARQVMAGPGNFDLLLSDVVLPGGISGPEFAKEVRAVDPNVKIVFMSGYADDTIQPDDFLESGIVLLNKPFRRQQLAETVQEALG